MNSKWQFWRRGTKPATSDSESLLERVRQQVPVPLIWLFGKTGSGKSSLIRALTGAEGAIIGEGYRPQTKTSQRFDFPDAVDPLLSFLDTRGLGEAAYDPTEDIKQFNNSAQLMIVTVRVTDHAVAELVDPLRRIRQSAPGRPIVLVLTCLHEAIGNIDLSEGPDPFEGVEDGQQASIPESLKTLIGRQRETFSGLYDTLIPVDLTRPEDGFADPQFGGQRLRHAILDHLPMAYRQALLSLTGDNQQQRSARNRQARRLVLAASAMAGTAGAVPIPWVDIPVVLAIQSHMAARLAKVYDQQLTASHWTLLSSTAGSRLAARMALRAGLKVIPWVGVAAGAASAFAVTYALGMAWDWYFASVRAGRSPDENELREIFAEQLKRGRELWRSR